MLLVYDVTDRASFDALGQWLVEMKENLPNPSDVDSITCAVCANKASHCSWATLVVNLFCIICTSRYQSQERNILLLLSLPYPQSLPLLPFPPSSFLFLLVSPVPPLCRWIWEDVRLTSQRADYGQRPEDFSTLKHLLRLEKISLKFFR